MRAKVNLMLVVSAMTVIGIMIFPVDATAENNQDSITITPINEEISLKKTTAIMTVPENNQLPWGSVKGAASEYVERYPVIIQFYKGDEPVHVAQVDVKGDGSYEYKFRVRNLDTDTGQFVNIFEGKYTVKIFRVIPNTNQIV